MTTTTNTSTTTDRGLIALTALFAAGLIASQVVSAKLVPVALPVVGTLTVTAGGVTAYAITFFASDCLAEVYGKRTAREVVAWGFVMNLVLLAVVWLTIALPTAPAGVSQNAFVTVLGQGTNVVLGSLTAYLVSQNVDISLFHWLRARTGGRWLWVRNIGSTTVSQAIDTALFVGVAFWLAPTVLGVGVALPATVLASLFVGEYLAKVALTVLDTPLVYAVVRAVGDSGGQDAEVAHAD